MAEYEIKYACGHTFTVECETEDERDLWQLVKGNQLCAECYERAEAEKVAGILAEDSQNGLPELTGSNDKIRTAVYVRRGFLDKAKRYVLAQSYDDFTAYACAQHTDAAWWADNRFDAFYPAVHEYCAEKGIAYEQVVDVSD